QVDPMYAFTFVRTFLNIRILRRSDCNSAQRQFDIVHQLLGETLDVGGHWHPLTAVPNSLRYIILPPSHTSNILSVTGVSG
ncbi:hypothetical protein EDB84DRAFT_1245184, partial [Lactarius hengduanensis]